MSVSETDARLVRMAEQIADNLGGASDPEVTGERAAAHMKRFWTPQMITHLLQLASAGGIELSPASRCAVQILSED